MKLLIGALMLVALVACLGDGRRQLVEEEEDEDEKLPIHFGRFVPREAQGDGTIHYEDLRPCDPHEHCPLGFIKRFRPWTKEREEAAFIDWGSLDKKYGDGKYLGQEEEEERGKKWAPY